MDALVALVAVVLLLLLPGGIVRFSVISAARARASRSRLRQPDAPGVAGLCGFHPPADLVDLYRVMPFVERVEFQLVDERQSPPRRFDVGAFIPLTPRDVREARAVHGIRDGIPIADDGDMGSYVLLPSGAIVLRSPNVPGREVAVAASASELKAFTPAEMDA
jgi:hypothetical protein